MCVKKILLLAMTGAVIAVCYAFGPYANQQEETVIQVMQPEINTIQDMVTLHGSVIDPERKKLYAKGNSYVSRIYVSEGETVKAGQLLMKLERCDSAVMEQTAAVSALVQLKDTIASGDLQEAETMLQDMITAGSINEDLNREEQQYSLFSPCDGFVLKLSAKQGDIINQFLPCIEITQPDRLQIKVAAGEEIIGTLAPNMECTITVPAFSLEQVPGILSQVEPYARETGAFTGNPVTQTNVYITPTAYSKDLRPGYRASAKVIVSKRENVLLLPYEAILQDEEGEEYVLSVQDDLILRRNILTGAELETQVEVLEGMDADTWVLQNPKAEWEGEEMLFVAP